MRMFKRVVFLFLGIIIIVPLVMLLIGSLASVTHKGSKSAMVKASSSEVWRLINDTEKFSTARHEVDSMRFLPLNSAGKKQWLEYVGFWGTMQYQVLTEVPDSLLEIEVIKSDFGISGRWTFLLKQIDAKSTEVTIVEDSKNEGLFMRSILATLGRNANLGLLLNVIKRNVKQMK